MFVLASNSPRRKELMKILAEDYEVLPAEIDEAVLAGESPTEYVKRMSAKKAEAVQKRRPNDLIIAADTIVVASGVIFGKPKTLEEAQLMLRTYSDDVHEVLTSVTLAFQNQVKTFVSQAKVHFYPVNEAEITSYLALSEWQDKAGAYGIQGTAAKFIRAISGDYLAIVGFPVAQIYQELPPFITLMEKFDLALEKTARETLEPLAYDVLKNAATEAPFTGKYDEFDAVGIYVDPLTGDVLFSSKDKFNSGCGWPAFAKPIGELKEQEDYSNNRVRMEIKSATSNSHLGHVFDDGPKESGGLRYCINSAALKFIPITEMEDKGYGSYLDLLK